MSRYAAKVVTYFDADVDHYIKQLNRADRRNKAFARNTRQAANDSARAIEQSFRGAGRGIAAIDGPLGGISGRFSALTALISESGAAFAVLGASVAGVVAMLGAAAFEGAKVEQLQLKTQAILKATGNAAGFTATELDRQARAIALATLASVDGVRGAQHRLLTFKAVTGDVFTETIKLSQDLAASGFGTLESNAIGLGKALQDPVTGLTLLNRQGSLTKTQQRQIAEAFQRTGDLGTAQIQILQAVREQVGGAGQAEAGGLSGAIDTLSQKWDELKEAVDRFSGTSVKSKSFLDQLSLRIDNLAKRLGGGEQLDARRELNRLHAQRVRYQEKLAKINARSVIDARMREEKQALEGLIAQRGREIALIQEKEKARQIAVRNEKASVLRQSQLTANQGRVEQIIAGFHHTAEDLDQFLAQEKIKNDRLVVLQRERFARLHEQALAAEQKNEALEQVRYEREKQKLAEERERFRNRGLLTAEIEQQFKGARENLEQTHLAKLEDMRQKALDKELAAQNKKYQTLIDLADRYNRTRSAGENRYATMAIGVAKTLFDVRKRQALKEAGIDAKVAIQKAWASAPFPANLPGVALVAAETAATVADIAGIAHGGLSFVPKANTTYVLDKGERVLAPGQNRDLEHFMRAGNAITVNVHNYSGEAVAVDRQGERLDIVIGRAKAAISEDIQRGTGLASVFQQTSGLRRRGVI
ncbi:MAG: phage tail length tape measure family protein [Exilibacterium sp.]